MTFIARGPVTWGTGGRVGFITGTGAGTTGAGAGAGAAGAGSGTGAVAGGGAAQALRASENAPSKRSPVPVVFMDVRSSFIRALIAWSIPA